MSNYFDIYLSIYSRQPKVYSLCLVNHAWLDLGPTQAATSLTPYPFPNSTFTFLHSFPRKPIVLYFLSPFILYSTHHYLPNLYFSTSIPFLTHPYIPTIYLSASIPFPTQPYLPPIYPSTSIFLSLHIPNYRLYTPYPPFPFLYTNTFPLCTPHPPFLLYTPLPSPRLPLMPSIPYLTYT